MSQHSEQIKQILKYFRRHTKAHKKYARLVFVFRTLTAIIGMVTPFLLKNIIDIMVQNPGAQISPEVIASLSAIVGWWILVYVIEFV